MYQAFDSLLAFQGQLLLVFLSFGMVFSTRENGDGAHYFLFVPQMNNSRQQQVPKRDDRYCLNDQDFFLACGAPRVLL
jgi:hypothetical protein